MTGKGAENLDGLLDLAATDVHVRHQTQARCRTDLDPALCCKVFERLGPPVHLRVHHIGLHRLNLIAGSAQAFGQQLGIGMIIGQTLDLVV